MADDDPHVTLYLTHKGQLYPFETHDSARWVVKEIFNKGEYGLLTIPDWEPATVVDVGANHGAFALFAAVHFPAARLLCFEPVEDSFGLLEKNLTGIDNTTCLPYGLLDRDASVPVYYGRHNPGEASIFCGEDQRDAPGETVVLKRATTELDRLGVDRIGILKVDTEGCELAILGDLEPRLPSIDYVLLEYHRDDDRRAIDDLLSPGFLLYGGKVLRPNTGVLKYINRRLVQQHAPEMLRPLR